MTYVVGVTGGIGSGKSAATAEFEKLGITVVDADVVARQVVMPGTPCLQAIAEHFGNQLLTEGGELNRKALRQRVFSNPREKEWLNELLHPAIRQELISQLELADSPYVILSAPLLLENGLEKYCQRVLVVDIPESLQISRTIQRDDSPKKEVEAIMKAQLSRSERLKKANDVLNNDGSLEQLEQQVLQLHQRYLAATVAQEK
ncbi:MAG TPA: dephospho-CoA kinase [Idiomarina abyssalis]|uniref:dephospho-CoA kinase n=1 Tax=Idiomarina TaxID=135575 RepID=UPI000C54A909|nr:MULTISPECIES: dephospho-CoA kinase [Idiomarina]MBH94292.1 dephospho-CoA kinase [Idiomarina sp.]MDA6067078.1 dephospho-CoA kinase [Idiomarina abyssalis]HAS16005.1 dephospho-CoA kinase [Idiomarina abyssalis]|tara:strand:+ start:41 stop:649 length:609 start_codon:yes stop_codon:yes gene_type:complete